MDTQLNYPEIVKKYYKTTPIYFLKAANTRCEQSLTTLTAAIYSLTLTGMVVNTFIIHQFMLTLSTTRSGFSMMTPKKGLRPICWMLVFLHMTLF